VMSRSLDGGQTWKLERPEAFSEKRRKEEGVACPGDINFTQPDFAMRVKGDGFHISYDRGHTWAGPYKFPDLGVKLGGRTDYIINGKNDCTIMLNAYEGPTCVRTTDGGRTFNVLGNVMPRREYHAIMPSTIRLSANHLVCAVRQLKGEPYVSWIDAYESNDDGKTWKFLSKVADADRKYWNGNPPSMVKLDDGRICITYGYRAFPYGMSAKISSDNGRTWGKAIILRQDGRNWDLGYSRSVKRTDGKLVTMYYYSTPEQPEQFIAATIWDPRLVDSQTPRKYACDQMLRNIQAIENCIVKIEELSRQEVKSVNPLVWWTQEKEINADRLSTIAGSYFLAQEVEPPKNAEGPEYAEYVRKTTLLQRLLFYTSQAKENNNLSNVENLRSTLEQLRDAISARTKD